jgi:hypothetical protein
MLYREIIAVCSEIHTKHTNTQSGHNVHWVLNLVVHTRPKGLSTRTVYKLSTRGLRPQDMQHADVIPEMWKQERVWNLSKSPGPVCCAASI